MNLETINESKFKKIIRDVVEDVLKKEMAKLRLLIASYISDEEQKEIEANYKKPSKRTAKTLLLKE